MDRTLSHKKTNFARWCLAVGLGLFLPGLAMADVISGRVLGPDEKPVLNATLTAKDAKGQTVTFKSDKSGNFSVYLDPGRYIVSNGADPSVEGVIESLPQPVQKDVQLKKKGQ